MGRNGDDIERVVFCVLSVHELCNFEDLYNEISPCPTDFPLTQGGLLQFQYKKHTALYKGIFASFIQRRWLGEPEDFMKN